MSLCKKVSDKDRMECFGGVIALQVLVKIRVIVQHRSGFLDDILRLCFCENACAECESCRADAMKPITGAAGMPAKSESPSVVNVPGKEKKNTTATILCWGVSWSWSSTSCGKATGRMNFNTQAIFSFVIGTSSSGSIACGYTNSGLDFDVFGNRLKVIADCDIRLNTIHGASSGVGRVGRMLVTHLGGHAGITYIHRHLRFT